MPAARSTRPRSRCRASSRRPPASERRRWALPPLDLEALRHCVAPAGHVAGDRAQAVAAGRKGLALHAAREAETRLPCGVHVREGAAAEVAGALLRLLSGRLLRRLDALLPLLDAGRRL